MKNKFFSLCMIGGFFTSHVANAYGAIICEPMGGSSYLCDAYVQNIDPLNASYHWTGSPGINAQGAGESAWVNCQNTSGLVQVNVTDNENGHVTLSRAFDCSDHGSINDPVAPFPTAQ